MGLELELIVLLIIQLTGSTVFAAFELETPIWRKLFKWAAMDGLTISLFFFVCHWALVFPLFMVVTGTIVHLRFCRKHHIDPLKATPRKKYYQLRGWKWQE